MNGFKSRKLLVTVLILLVGTLVELYAPNGLSATFAGLLAAVLTAYNVTNVMSSKHAPKDSAAAPALETKMDNLLTIIAQAANPEEAQAYKDDMAQVKEKLGVLIEAQSMTAKLMRAAIGLKQEQ